MLLSHVPKNKTGVSAAKPKGTMITHHLLELRCIMLIFACIPRVKVTDSQSLLIWQVTLTACTCFSNSCRTICKYKGQKNFYEPFAGKTFIKLKRQGNLAFSFYPLHIQISSAASDSQGRWKGHPPNN